MKKRLLLLIFLLTINGTMHAQGWSGQTTGFANSQTAVTQIDIVDANTVWILGGFFLSGQQQDILAATGYHTGSFSRTTNGGSTWIPGVITVGPDTATISNISAVSSTTAWIGISGSQDPNSEFGGQVWKTTNGGANWTQQNMAGYTYVDDWDSHVVSSLVHVHFFNANNGITIGNPAPYGFEVYRTTNGGTSWTQVASASLSTSLPEHVNMGRTASAGNSFWFTSDQGKIYRTIDMGATWSKFSSPLPSFFTTESYGEIHFSDNNNGIIIGTTNSGTTFKLYTTSNGGASWSAGTVYTGKNLKFSYVPNTNKIVATNFWGATASNHGSSYSTNKGSTWTQIDSGTKRGAVKFLNGTTGWCGGISGTSAGIYKFTGTLGVDDIDNNAEIIAYPNPVSDVLKLSAVSFNIVEVYVYDLLGKQVYHSNFSPSDQINLDLSTLASGTYHLKAIADNGTGKTIRIVKN